METNVVLVSETGNCLCFLLPNVKSSQSWHLLERPVVRGPLLAREARKVGDCCSRGMLGRESRAGQEVTQHQDHTHQPDTAEIIC